MCTMKSGGVCTALITAASRCAFGLGRRHRPPRCCLTDGAHLVLVQLNEFCVSILPFLAPFHSPCQVPFLTSKKALATMSCSIRPANDHTRGPLAALVCCVARPRFPLLRPQRNHFWAATQRPTAARQLHTFLSLQCSPLQWPQRAPLNS